jgi:RNA recognition motif-containing protein
LDKLEQSEVNFRIDQVNLGCAGNDFSTIQYISCGECVKLAKKLYVGNLSFQATENEVEELFAEYGDVESIAWITDRDTGRFRGFCFVEMNPEAADAAIEALDGKEIGGRNLRVNEARPKEKRSGGKRW